MKYLWSLHKAALSPERINASIWSILSAVKFFKLRACVKALARSVFSVLAFAARRSAELSPRGACLFLFWLTDLVIELPPESKPDMAIPNSSETIFSPYSLTTNSSSYWISSFFSSSIVICTFLPSFYVSSPFWFKLDFLRFASLALCVFITLSASATPSKFNRCYILFLWPSSLSLSFWIFIFFTCSNCSSCSIFIRCWFYLYLSFILGSILFEIPLQWPSLSPFSKVFRKPCLVFFIWSKILFDVSFIFVLMSFEIYKLPWIEFMNLPKGGFVLSWYWLPPDKASISSVNSAGLAS